MRGGIQMAAGACLAATIALSSPASAQDEELSAEQQRFVRSNTITTLYHEFGHALIDTMSIRMLAKEEDAADIFSIVLIDHLNAGSDADILATDTAFYYYYEDVLRENEGRPYDFTAEHSTDIERYYTIACLHYGANPTARQPFLESLDVPDDLIAACEERRQFADDGWEWILRQIEQKRGGEPSIAFYEDLQPSNRAETAARNALRSEVQYMAEMFSLPVPVSVVFSDCDGDSNAYYDPNETQILSLIHI